MESPKLLSTNQIKLEEARSIIPQIQSIPFDRAEIQSPDPRIVVREKLSEAALLDVPGPILVEDTALEIDSWKGLPGAFIKWFVERWGAAGVARSMRENWDTHGAQAVSVVGVWDRGETEIWTGKLRGEIVLPRGDLGGWTPIFEAAGTKQTLAEMHYRDRLSITMRRQPLEDAARWLIGRGSLVADNSWPVQI